ncbi:MAG: glycogen synthase GlgA [Candidatus Omnitrophica bacterium]|nr:glycogen synthase GlgA [Candidatus Omnitrophota bacterium]
MKKKLSVAFLWHMHQPLYKDFVTGKYHLPWVRLHSTYSYLDMASILEDFPGVKVTFNLTPSLIWQLRDLSGDGEVDDLYLKLTEKDAASLTEDDKYFLLRNFFSCDLDKAIFPLKRYKELFYKRGSVLKEEQLRGKTREFTADQMRDLQVLFNLAWCGFTLKDKDPLVRELFHKGAGYTEKDKAELLKRQKEVVRSIIPLYKRLQDEGRIEISTTPYYHPILPLLCRCSSGQGYDFQDDAKVHVRRAIELYREVFGRKPAGMWPAEGSVSQEIIPILEEEGVGWIATDEGILLESFKGEDLLREELIYKAYTAREDGRSIDILFRDINISNAISFRYANMPTKKACADMIRDINCIYKNVSRQEGEHVVSVILDGENPWPYFPDGGKDFLSQIYKRLSSCKSLEMVTMDGYLETHKERREIPELYSGSWINRDFSKWIGSPQKNKAWDYLEKARRELFAEKDPPKEALEELYISEGSDWFWWYDDFGSELNFVFDELFRMHLANIYRLMKRNIPHHLEEPIHAGPAAQKLERSGTPLTMGKFPRVLLVSSEVVPFAKTGGLADVAGSLPKALNSLGCDVRVVMPLYKCVWEGAFDLSKEPVHSRHGWRHKFQIYSTRSEGMTTYFVKDDRLFGREGLYGTQSGDYQDNAVRFGFFSKAVLDTIKGLDFKPDIIHCNDWQTALIPFYMKFKFTDDDYFNGIRTLFTIHNMAYQGVFPRRTMKSLGIPEGFFNMNDLEFYGKINFMKSGILYSDAVSTVSHKYAEEIMTSEYGCGLDGLLRTKKDVLYGIPNGVDYSVWSPKKDKYIKVNYDMETLDKKAECKKDLIDHAGLKLSQKAPLIGCVTRFAEQKGVDLLADIAQKIVGLGAGLVVLGKGEKRYNRLFRDLAKKHPENIYVCTDFNDELAHKIEAGCDIFVMPSRYEPCGLNQMYSIKYGTIPVVRNTGGLDDVIVDFDENRQESNGFKFGPATSKAFWGALKRAVEVYNNEDSAWKKLVERAMKCDFSWRRSAEQYLRLYRKIIG